LSLASKQCKTAQEKVDDNHTTSAIHDMAKMRSTTHVAIQKQKKQQAAKSHCACTAPQHNTAQHTCECAQRHRHRDTHTHTQSKARHQAATSGRCAHLRCALSGVCRSPCQQERSWGCCAGAPPGCLPALPHQARAPPPCVTTALASSGLDPAPASQQT